MIWYKYLYLGETAKKHRFSILQKLRLGKVQPGVHVITPASGGHNLLDILPAYVLRQNYYREQADLLIVGVGASYQDAVETVGRNEKSKCNCTLPQCGEMASAVLSVAGAAVDRNRRAGADFCG